jgi:hypothetical protein
MIVLIFVSAFLMYSCEKQVTFMENSSANCEGCSELNILEARGLPVSVLQVNNYDARSLRNNMTILGSKIDYNKFNWKNVSYIKLEDNSKIYSIELNEKNENESESIVVVENSGGVNYYHMVKNYSINNDIFSGNISIWDLNNDEYVHFEYSDDKVISLNYKENKCAPSSVGSCILDNLNGAGGWEMAGCIFLGKWCAAGLVALCTICVVDGGCSSPIYCQ